MPKDHADSRLDPSLQVPSMKALRQECANQRHNSEAAVFAIQYAFFREDLYSDPGIGFDPRKFQRLIGATNNLLGVLHQWQRAETKIVSLNPTYHNTPDRPENDVSPAELSRRAEAIASEPPIDG